MGRKFCFRLLLITILLSIPLSPISFNTYAGGPEVKPPGPDEHLVGPKIVGTVTLIYSGDPEDQFVKAIFYGYCKGLPYPLKKKFCTWAWGVPTRFQDVKNKDQLQIKEGEWRIDGAGPEDCHSECGGEDLIITRVKNFRRLSPLKIAIDVEMLFVVPVGAD